MTAWTRRNWSARETLLRSDRITALQSSFQRAKLLATYEVLDGKPDYINQELDRLLAVTPAQIQAAAKQYLAPDRRSVLQIAVGPKPQPSASGVAKGGN